MRLMEVDEAASHIKELVDPDANIIWGSAFNNDLGGKIRVSVVATGIEAETVSQPQPAKVFSFPAARPVVAAAPAAPLIEAAETPDEADEDDALELGQDDEAEELVLGDDDILTTPVTSAPIAPPTEDEDEAKVDEQPRTNASGGTLFERMSNIARGAAQAKVDEDDAAEPGFRREPIDIPRFLNRQNNQ
jgi:cell division protein FtsZ